MLELWLIRHGETDWNAQQRWQGHTDTMLNETGRRQAATLTERLQSVPFDEVFASDLARAVETARIAMPTAKPVRDARLREMNFGAFEGKTWDELVASHGDARRRWIEDPQGFRLPDGESFGDLVDRVSGWLNECHRGRVAVFTHGGPIRAAMYLLECLPEQRLWGHRIQNCSINRLRCFTEEAVVIAMNETEHLDVPAEGM